MWHAADPQSDARAGIAQVAWLRAELDGAGRREQPLRVVGDAHFETLDGWRHLPARTILLVRTACNRALWHRPAVGASTRRKYGERAPQPQAMAQLSPGSAMRSSGSSFRQTR